MTTYKDGQGERGEQDLGRDAADHDNGGDHVEGAHEPAADVLRDERIYGVRVLGEAVEDAADGRGVVEVHGGAQAVGEDAVVQVGGRADGAHCQHE